VARGVEVRLKSAADGFEFGAYRVPPADVRHGGLVLIQEIFGVTPDIRALCEDYAEAGYEVIAPSLFDRLRPGFTADASPEGLAEGRAVSEATPWDQVAGDLTAAIAALAGPVFVVGYCWGGTAAWLAACRCDGVAASSAFYGRRIPELLAETPRCPTILHFGKQDASIPAETVEAIAVAHPDLPLYRYDAGHGFVSNRPGHHHADSARLARLRTLQLFQRASGARGEH
jgi:carboxymethylenebutenolidase